METFSKLRPPEAVRIKAKLVEPISSSPSPPSNNKFNNYNNQEQQSYMHHPLEQLLNGNEQPDVVVTQVQTNSSSSASGVCHKDRRISSASQISTVSSSSCTSYASSSCVPTSTSVTAAGLSSYRISELKKFCVDPQVTSFDVLTDLIAHAFDIKWYDFFLIFIFKFLVNFFIQNHKNMILCFFLFLAVKSTFEFLF